jgi:mannosyltransferase
VKQNLSKFLILAVAALFLFVRLWHLTDSCLWFDEIFSVHAATNNWNHFFSFIAQDIVHPPLFYLLLKFWLAIGGESLLWTRLFAVVFAVLSIAPFLLICRELKLSKTQVLIGFIAFAVNGSLIKYAQEVRMYSLLVFLSLTSIWLFFRWQHNAKGRLIGLLIVNLLLIYTHYFGWLIVITELCVVIWRRDRIKNFVSQTAFLFVGFVPWAILVFNAWRENSGLSQNIGWQSRPNLWQFFSSLHQPFYFPTSNLEATVVLLSLPILLVCLGLIINEFISNRRDTNLQILAAFVVIPIALAFIAGWIFPISIWGIRHLTVIFPPYFILLAISFSNFQWKSIAISVILILVLISGIVEFRRPKVEFIWCTWERLAAEVPTNAKIYAFEDLVAYHLWFANKSFEVTKINGYLDLPEDKAYFLPRGFSDIKIGDKSSFSGDSFYLAFRDEKTISLKDVLKDLRLNGYKIDEPIKIESQGLNAFMFRVSKYQ